LLIGACLSNGYAALPPGAAELGYEKCVINETPVPADVAPGDKGSFKWFNGQWYFRTRPTPDHYSLQGGALALSLGGDLVSTPRTFSSGRLPTLPGAAGFYVEFDVQVSDSDPDHFPAVWLMPVEHNRQKDDHYGQDPAGFERFLEIDVMEKMAYKGPGLIGTIHNWTGIYPHYKNLANTNNISPVLIDFTQRHTFGASYNPLRQQVTWWVDGLRQMSIGAPCVPDIAKQQHFYLIISAQTHGKKIPHYLFIRGVRAYVPRASPLPPARK
jgi:hypothetical protein